VSTIKASYSEFKKYPLDHHTFPDSFSVAVSDNGTLVYVTAIDHQRNNKSSLLVFKIGAPKVFTIYDEINFDQQLQDPKVLIAGRGNDNVIVA
jgi:hypothetical protein